jgi:putative CocE/NonD family hydrolase
VARQWQLVDVYPDGRAINLNNGIIRARFRNSLERAEQVTPGQVHEYTIQIWPTSNLYKTGHRIRLEISSSNFPHYDRNLNTGHEFGQDSAMLVAEQTIYHDRERASRVVLPIIPQVLQ